MCASMADWASPRTGVPSAHAFQPFGAVADGWFGMAETLEY